MAPSRGLISSIFIRLMAVARYRFIAELTVIFAAVWVGCALLVYFLEVGINPRIHGPVESIYFLLVAMMTSGDSAVVPLTTGGRLVMSVVVILSKLLTALLCALAAAVLIERKLKEEMGLKMHTLEKHIVLVGWNLKGVQIVSTLRNDPRHHSTPILVMADLEQKPVDDPFLQFTRSTYPIRGDALARASLASAALVVLLANYNERQHADALTTVNCLMVRKTNPSARIVAELLDPSQRLYLEAAGADAIISIGDVGGFLLAEAAIGNLQAQQLLDAVARRPVIEDADE
ncbi:MAG: NAD-binding protein [Rhodoferax sp.]|nr:NAD-binding protein [Rhodoferax sp.]MDP3653750.1 NAD-binding protein [Rhodoferax sp.]